jgi:hypothetical protein
LAQDSTEPRQIPEFHRQRALSRYEETVSQLAEDTPIDVFVMGPYVDTTVPVDNLVPAARLRQALIKKCDEVGYAVPADLEEVIDIVTRQFGGQADLCTVEQMFADTVDLLVFIPDSNGSAAEVGFFAGLSDNRGGEVGRKAVILLDETHEATPGFVARGPVELLRGDGAIFEYVDYTDFDKVWPVVDRALLRAKGRRARRASAEKILR